MNTTFEQLEKFWSWWHPLTLLSNLDFLLHLLSGSLCKMVAAYLLSDFLTNCNWDLTLLTWCQIIYTGSRHWLLKPVPADVLEITVLVAHIQGNNCSECFIICRLGNFWRLKVNRPGHIRLLLSGEAQLCNWILLHVDVNHCTEFTTAACWCKLIGIKATFLDSAFLLIYAHEICSAVYFFRARLLHANDYNAGFKSKYSAVVYPQEWKPLPA